MRFTFNDLDPHLADWSLGFNIDPEDLVIERQIGQGSSGEVYQATWNNFQVCAKVLNHTFL